MVVTNFAELDAEQLEKINSLADEMGIILVAYNKTMATASSDEGGSNEANKQKNDHFQ
ncbi:hypothetical protein [Solibacillus sp. CAU 1738]|uniref:hypothetical protein n=1 Tax=Solibacillus sp. CAU 1738 TaxID=3140363 RepID=UPI003260BEE0